jgi:CelD/BcsL family acetyltransferase involved in cellulose biosynthesis
MFRQLPASHLMPDIELAPVGDVDALGKRWRRLESQSAASFFQSWTYMGCLVEERFAGGSLLSVRDEGEDIALALMGQAHKRFFLNESGNAAFDSVFIEHNAILAKRDATRVALPALRHALATRPVITLSGVTGTTIDAAGKAGWLRRYQKRVAPFAALSAHEDPLAAVSGNLRAQLKRAERLYGGSILLERAASLPQALDFFAELVATHQAAWRARGKPGAFANPCALRFHETLIRRAWPDGEADILRVTAGARLIGALYNFVRDGRVSAYQSGFVYGSDNREKPGLLCHAMALRHYAARGMSLYDFLAGADRYKMRFARETTELHWAQLYRPWSIQALLALCRPSAA